MELELEEGLEEEELGLEVEMEMEMGMGMGRKGMEWNEWCRGRSRQPGRQPGRGGGTWAWLRTSARKAALDANSWEEWIVNL